MIYLSFFFSYFLGTPFSWNIPYLVATSESIVFNILTIKNTKKIFSFSKKHVAKNREFLSENLNAKAVLKNIKSQDCHKNISFHLTFIYFFVFYFLFICLCICLFFIFNQKKLLAKKSNSP